MNEDLTRVAGRCPSCGRALRLDAPEGLCAVCLLAVGTETLTVSSVDEMPTRSSAGGWRQSAAAHYARELLAKHP